MEDTEEARKRRSEENCKWVRDKYREKYGEEAQERIEKQAHLIYLKRFAPQQVINQRFEDLMFADGWGDGDFGDYED